MDKQEQLQGMHDHIEGAVQRLLDSDSWQLYLAVLRNHHRYSINNQFLIWMQFPTATRVAGYQAWQKMNRQVVKGAKSIAIYGPPGSKRIWEEDDDSGERKSRTITFPTINRVFDISQTEVINPDIPDLTEVAQVHLDGADDLGLTELFTQLLADQQVAVETGAHTPTFAEFFRTTGLARAPQYLDIAARTATVPADYPPARRALALIRAATEFQTLASGVTAADSAYPLITTSAAHATAAALGLDTSAETIPQLAECLPHDIEALKTVARQVTAVTQEVLELVENTRAGLVPA